MNQNPKMSLANEIFEICIKLNLETKRGNDTGVIINKLRDKLENLASVQVPTQAVSERKEKVTSSLS